MATEYVRASELSEMFARELNKKFHSHRTIASGGTRFDRIWVRSTFFDCGYEILAVIDKTTGGLIKARPDGHPERKSGNREVVMRYDLSNKEDFEKAVLDADPYGSFLYLR